MHLSQYGICSFNNAWKTSPKKQEDLQTYKNVIVSFQYLNTDFFLLRHFTT